MNDERYYVIFNRDTKCHFFDHSVCDRETGTREAYFNCKEDAQKFADLKNAEAKITAYVGHDDCFQSGPEDIDLGTFVCWHKRRDLGTINYPKHEEFLESVSEQAIRFPVYIYDHCSIALSVGPFQCQFDSGQVGVWVFEPDECEKIWGPKADEWEKKAYECVKAWCAYLTDVYNGNVWYFAINRGDGEALDSCSGFVGDDALEDMKQHCDDKYHALLEKAWEERLG